MKSPLLQVNNLKVNFVIDKRNQLTAVENVSFSLEKGKTLGIVGESGCGKSVTATSIMRLLPKKTGRIADGSILFHGADILKFSEKEMCNIRGNRISMVFQDPMTALNPVYSIGQQLVEAIRAHDKTVKKAEAYERSVKMLEKVGIPLPERRINDYPHQLSGGMRQRVMTAMALLSNVELLIADEPTTALDVTIQAQILELIAELQNSYQMAIILITHDMGVVSDMADDVLIMYAGEVVEYGDVGSLFRTPLHPYTFGLLQSIPRMDNDVEELYTIPGVVPTLSEMPGGCRFSTRCQERLGRCTVEKPSLFELGDRKVRCWKYEKDGA